MRSTSYLVTVDEVPYGNKEPGQSYRNTYAVLAPNKPAALRITKRAFRTMGVRAKVAHVERTVSMDEYNYPTIPE